jgi:hypothetical protein
MSQGVRKSLSTSSEVAGIFRMWRRGVLVDASVVVSAMVKDLVDMISVKK